MRLLMIVAVALVLAGCATVQNANQAGGFIQHGVGADREKIQEMADNECARYDRDAELGDVRSAGMWTPRGTDFDCVDP